VRPSEQVLEHFGVDFWLCKCVELLGCQESLQFGLFIGPAAALPGVVPWLLKDAHRPSVMAKRRRSLACLPGIYACAMID
jgi:hypothetical protein